MQAWEQPRTALLVSERLINCPPQLGPPLQQALFDEIEWATEDEPTAVIISATIHIDLFHLLPWNASTCVVCQKGGRRG